MGFGTLQFSGSLRVNDPFLGALCPSKSGLMKKHIVKLGQTHPFTAKKAHCGTLCKLKKLVIKTRGTISAELDKAMD